MMDHSTSEVRKYHREGEKLASTVTPRPVILLLEYKRLLCTVLIDLSFGFISVAVIQGDESSLEHMGPLTEGTHSSFAGLTVHPILSSQELNLEVMSSFKVSSTDSSTALLIFWFICGTFTLLCPGFNLHSYKMC